MGTYIGFVVVESAIVLVSGLCLCSQLYGSVLVYAVVFSSPITSRCFGLSADINMIRLGFSAMLFSKTKLVSTIALGVHSTSVTQGVNHYFLDSNDEVRFES